MIVSRVLLLAALLIALSAELHACPCRGSSGPGAALTGRTELFGVNAMESARVVHGSWDPHGQYAPLSSDSLQYLLDVSFAAAVRFQEHFELAAESAVGHQSVSTRGFASERTGPGDTVLRLRWEAMDEPMPYEASAAYRPALAVIAGIRAPTGTLDRASTSRGVASGTTGSVGATASSQGLGAWETGAALSVQKVYRARYGIDWIGEVAYRFSDDALGLERQLGPRAFGQVGVRYLPSATTGIGIFTDLGWEAAVAYEGETRAGTAQRLWNIGLFGFWLHPRTGLRSGAMLRYAPPVDSISVNAVGATTVSVSLGYSR
jgi:hypothetical protein